MSKVPVAQHSVTSLKWRYHVVEELSYSSDTGQYRTYGIQATGRIENGWELLEAIHDVAVNRNAVEAMAALFTKYQLDPIHFHDAVEDMLP